MTDPSDIIRAAAKLPDPGGSPYPFITLAVTDPQPIDLGPVGGRFQLPPESIPMRTVTFRQAWFKDPSGRSFWRWECPDLPGRYFDRGGERED